MVALERTTNSKGRSNCSWTTSVFDVYEIPFTGLIRETNWYGTDGMVHARTIKEPKQPIPTFIETLDLLMKVSAVYWISAFAYLSMISTNSQRTDM